MPDPTNTTDGSSDDVPDWNPEPLELDNLGTVLTDTLGEWVHTAVTMLPNIVVAVIVLAAGWVVARVAAGLFRRFMDRVSSHQQVNGLLTAIFRAVLVGAALFAALSILHLDGVVTSMLAGVGVVGLALGFAFQDIAANLMSGVLMATSQPFQVGDIVKTPDHFGTIESVGMRVTQMRTFTGELVLIPNQHLTSQALVNYTETENRRVDIDVGVAYGDDLELARTSIVSALEGQEYVDDEREVQVLYSGFGGSSIDMSVRFWIRTRGQFDYLQARSEGIITIKKAIDDAGLNIPFPIRTLDFGADQVGGERIDRSLQPLVTDRDAA